MYLIPLGLLCLQPHNPTAFNALGLVGHVLFIKHMGEREREFNVETLQKGSLGSLGRREMLLTSLATNQNFPIFTCCQRSLQIPALVLTNINAINK